MPKLRKSVIGVILGIVIVAVVAYLLYSSSIIRNAVKNILTPYHKVTVSQPTSKAIKYFVNSDAGGDGYTPIVYENQAGETLIFEIYHHNPKFIGFNDAPNINCVIALQNKICPGYPKYFSSIAGDSGASQPSNANTIATSM